MNVHIDPVRLERIMLLLDGIESYLIRQQVPPVEWVREIKELMTDATYST